VDGHQRHHHGERAPHLEQMQTFVQVVSTAIDDYLVPYRGQQGEGTRAVQIHFNAFPVLDAETANTPSKPSGESA